MATKLTAYISPSLMAVVAGTPVDGRLAPVHTVRSEAANYLGFGVNDNQADVLYHAADVIPSGQTLAVPFAGLLDAFNENAPIIKLRALRILNLSEGLTAYINATGFTGLSDVRIFPGGSFLLTAPRGGGVNVNGATMNLSAPLGSVSFDVVVIGTSS